MSRGRYVGKRLSRRLESVWEGEEREKDGDLSVRFYGRWLLIEKRVLRIIIDYIRSGAS